MYDHQITFLYVRDLDRSADFYGRVLGLPLVLDQGGCRIFAVSEGAFLGVCALRPDRVGIDGALVTFVTEEVEAVHDRLVAAGADIESPPAHNPDYRIFHFYARDPDGNRFEVQRFDNRRWNVADG